MEVDQLKKELQKCKDDAHNASIEHTKIEKIYRDQYQKSEDIRKSNITEKRMKANIRKKLNI